MSADVRPVQVPPLQLTGGCQCGAVRYSVSAEPVTCYLCHCSMCRRQSGSVFGMSLQFPTEAVALEGPTTRLEMTGGSGRLSHQEFCPASGSRLTHRVAGRDIVVVKPGTLDDAGWLSPAGQIFTASRAPWLPPTPPEQLDCPDCPDMPELHRRWARMIAAGRNATGRQGEPNAR